MLSLSSHSGSVIARWLSLSLFLATILLTPAIWSSDPRPVAICDHCETIEVNHLYDAEGDLNFTQFIFRDPDAIVDWRIRNPDMAIWRSPGGSWCVSWLDGSHLRQVRAIRVVETHTVYDPELFERESFPVEWRRKLSEPLRVERSVLKP